MSWRSKSIRSISPRQFRVVVLLAVDTRGTGVPEAPKPTCPSWAWVAWRTLWAGHGRRLFVRLGEPVARLGDYPSQPAKRCEREHKGLTVRRIVRRRTDALLPAAVRSPRFISRVRSTFRNAIREPSPKSRARPTDTRRIALAPRGPFPAPAAPCRRPAWGNCATSPHSMPVRRH